MFCAIFNFQTRSSKRITIEEEIDVEGNGKAFEVKGGKWKSCVTAVKGSWIRKLY